MSAFFSGLCYKNTTIVNYDSIGEIGGKIKSFPFTPQG